MKKKGFFVFGLPVVLLALGLVFVSCDNGTDDGDGEIITVNITGLSANKEVEINRGWTPGPYSFVSAGYHDIEATADANGKVSVEFDWSWEVEQQLGEDETPIYIVMDFPGEIIPNKVSFGYISKNYFIWKPRACSR